MNTLDNSTDTNEFELSRQVEALLFACTEPLSSNQIKQYLGFDGDILPILEAMRAHYYPRGVQLLSMNEYWQFRTSPDLSWLFVETRQTPKRLSKVAQEVLAIIAYHQPITRAEIENLRGVGLSKGSLDQLLEEGLIKIKGRRRTPGRPVVFATTPQFLELYALSSLQDLPGQETLKAAGLLELDMPLDFSMPEPALIGRIGLDDELEDETSAFADDFLASE
jgi:segregation and condensation protein B